MTSLAIEVRVHDLIGYSTDEGYSQQDTKQHERLKHRRSGLRVHDLIGYKGPGSGFMTSLAIEVRVHDLIGYSTDEGYSHQDTKQHEHLKHRRSGFRVQAP